MGSLTLLQQRFVQVLLENPLLEPAEAYIRASGKATMKRKVAMSCASKLLKKASIKDALADVKYDVETRRSEALAVTVDNVLTKYSQIAFGDVTEIVSIETHKDEESNTSWQRVVIKDTKQLPPQLRVMIKGIKEHVSAQGDRTIEVLFHDQLRAMEALARYVGIWRDNILAAQVILKPQVIEKRWKEPIDAGLDG